MVAGIAFPDAVELAVRRRPTRSPPRAPGLTPLLQHPAMAIHPPMLYSGYVFFTIPFAFAVGALITRRLDASWIRSTRRFALIAWLFLTVGVALGARWSYCELGWGGYWAWDPVENAALIPWLTGTAFLHSIMVQERRGMLRTWNVSLICATFALSLLGHVPRPLRGPAVDPRLRRVEGRAAAARPDRVDRDRLDDPDRQPARLAALRAPPRLDLQPRVGLPRQQPAARRPRRGGRLGDVLPADLGGGRPGETSSLGGALVQPLRDPAGDRAGPLHGHRAAGRMAAGDPGGPAPCGRDPARGDRRRPRSPWRSTIGVAESPTAYALFLVATFTIVAIGAGDLARHRRPASARRRRPARGARLSS